MGRVLTCRGQRPVPALHVVCGVCGGLLLRVVLRDLVPAFNSMGALQAARYFYAVKLCCYGVKHFCHLTHPVLCMLAAWPRAFTVLAGLCGGEPWPDLGACLKGHLALF